MAGATLHGLLTGLAPYCTTIPGIKRGLYPAVGIPAPGDMPAIVLFGGSPQGMSLIEPNADGAMWTAEIAGQLLIANIGDIEKHIGQGDRLMTSIVDAFTVQANGRNPALDAIDAGGQLDYLTLYGYQLGGIDYAGHQYYGANLFFRAKFHRYPAEVTP